MILDKLSLGGKVAIVTGAGTGLGKAMCLALAKAGADIVAAARRAELIEQTASEVKELGRRSLAVPTDVTDSRQVNQMVDRSLSEFGKIDILVNNAGIVRGDVPRPIWEISDDDWHLGIDTNLSGAFYCSRAVVKHMAERKSGKVINFASGFGLRGARDNYMYCCAKGAVVQLTRSLALSLARDDVQVNAIAPGFFATLPPDSPEASHLFTPERSRFIPAGRLGHPDEIGPLAIFLASSASDYITGEVFVIDGGGLAGGYAPTGYAPSIAIEED